MDFTSIPLVDVGSLIRGTGDRAGAVARLDDACHRCGFFYVTGHGIDVGDLEAQARAFFAQPVAAKRTIEMAHGGRAPHHAITRIVARREGAARALTGVDCGVRLVDYAKAHLVTVAVGAVGPLIVRGAITVNGRIGTMSEPVGPDDVIAVDPTAHAAAFPLVPEARALAICFEDEDLLVVDKPAGIHVHPMGPYRTGTLMNALLAHAGATLEQPWAAWRPHPAHRLDRATSGLVIIAKRAAIHEALRSELAAHRIRRRYRATVHGRVALSSGTIDAPLGRDPTFDYRRAVVPITEGGQSAVTHYRVVERTAEHTVLDLELATGRTHQIRVHLASIGHNIVGDTIYASGNVTREDASQAIALRAIELRFAHPRDGREITCMVQQ